MRGICFLESGNTLKKGNWFQSSELSLMMEAVRTSETSVDNYFTRQYIPEDNSELHTRRRENLKSHMVLKRYQLKRKYITFA
jgi:hypothetical protein